MVIIGKRAHIQHPWPEVDIDAVCGRVPSDIRSSDGERHGGIRDVIDGVAVDFQIPTPGCLALAKVVCVVTFQCPRGNVFVRADRSSALVTSDSASRSS